MKKISLLKHRAETGSSHSQKTTRRAYAIIITFAIALCILIAFNNYRSVKSEFATRASLLGKRHSTYFSQVLYTCRFIVDKGRTDKKYTDWYGSFDITSKLEIIDELREMRMLSPFYEYIYFIHHSGGRIYGSDGEYEEESFLQMVGGIDMPELVDFISSGLSTMMFRGNYRSQDNTMVLMKADRLQGALFLFMLNEETLRSWIDLSLEEEMLSETILSPHGIVFSSTEEEGGKGAVKWTLPSDNSLTFVFSVPFTSMLAIALGASLPYIFTVAIISVACMVAAAATIRAWNRPIKEVLDYVSAETNAAHDEKNGANGFLTIIDEFKSLKSLNLSYNTERLLFRLLFSKNDEEITKCIEECKNHGLDMDGRYFFTMICPSEGDGIIVGGIFTEDVNTKCYKLYISDTEIVILACALCDLIELQALVKELSAKSPNTIVSEISDRITMIPKCFALAQQALLKDRIQNPNDYPREEIKTLCMAIDMGSAERMAIAMHQILLVSEKCEKRIRLAVLYDVCNMLCEGREKEELIDNRFNLEYLEVLSQKVYSRLLGMIKEDTSSSEYQKNIGSIEAYIKAHCTEKNYSIKALAYAFNISYSNLCHYYKANTGSTIAEFTEKYKISNACRLLKTGMKVSDVAEKLGYNSSQTFSRVFKKYKGMLPKDYVKSSKAAT